MATSLSTLTQTSLDEAMSKMRVETERTIQALRNELKTDVKSMEEKIAKAVITAIRTSPPVENMETDQMETNSTQSSYQETAVTTQTLADKVDSLTSIVQLLAEKVAELSERQETQTIQRNRPLATPPKFRLPTTNDAKKTPQQSPPTKVLRSELTPERSKTPPPNGTSIVEAREGQ
jgi:outer membrane murein-binding lipoprotein Lpp